MKKLIALFTILALTGSMAFAAGINAYHQSSKYMYNVNRQSPSSPKDPSFDKQRKDSGRYDMKKQNISSPKNPSYDQQPQRTPNYNTPQKYRT